MNAALTQVVHLEQYIEGTYFLSTELSRLLNLIKSLDERCSELSETLQYNTSQLLAMPPQYQQTPGPEYADLMRQVDTDQRMLSQFAEEKIQVAQQVYDLLETHALELERTMDNFESDMRVLGGGADLDLGLGNGLDGGLAGMYTPGGVANFGAQAGTPKPDDWVLPSATDGVGSLPLPPLPPLGVPAATNKRTASAAGVGAAAGSSKAASAQPAKRLKSEEPSSNPVAIPSGTSAGMVGAPAGGPAGATAAAAGTSELSAVQLSGLPPIPPLPAATAAAVPTAPQGLTLAPPPPPAGGAAGASGYKKRTQSTSSLMGGACVGSLGGGVGAVAGGGGVEVGMDLGALGLPGTQQQPGELAQLAGLRGAALQPLTVGFSTPAPPGMQASSKTPQVPNCLMSPADITPALRGRHAELYWPDDQSWWLIEIQDVDVITRKARIVYMTGEVEEALDLHEVVRDKHMSLVPLERYNRSS